MSVSRRASFAAGIAAVRRWVGCFKLDPLSMIIEAQLSWVGASTVQISNMEKVESFCTLRQFSKDYRF